MAPCTQAWPCEAELTEAALFLAALGRIVDQRYEAVRPDAEDLDAALEEELERVDAVQRQMLEDFDPAEELEPEEELALEEELFLLALASGL